MSLQVKTVQSSNLDKIGYNVKHQDLFIMFKGGATYVYPGVEPLIFFGLLAAESKGSYFNRHIKMKQGQIFEQLEHVPPEFLVSVEREKPPGIIKLRIRYELFEKFIEEIAAVVEKDHRPRAVALLEQDKKFDTQEELCH